MAAIHSVVLQDSLLVIVIPFHFSRALSGKAGSLSLEESSKVQFLVLPIVEPIIGVRKGLLTEIQQVQYWRNAYNKLCMYNFQQTKLEQGD